MVSTPSLANLPSKDILGNITEVCIVTSNLHSKIDGLSKLGIGPFQIFDFNSRTVKNQELRGSKGDDLFEIRVAFAKQPNGLVFEIMQPTNGQSLMQEYLDRTGKAGGIEDAEGVQHLAFDMHDLPMAERQRVMKEHGLDVAMQGVWLGRKGTCHFCFFDTLEKGCGTVLEAIEFSPDWEDPDEEGGFCGWYPSLPSG